MAVTSATFSGMELIPAPVLDLLERALAGRDRKKREQEEERGRLARRAWAGLLARARDDLGDLLPCAHLAGPPKDFDHRAGCARHNVPIILPGLGELQAEYYLDAGGWQRRPGWYAPATGEGRFTELEDALLALWDLREEDPGF